MAATRFYLPSTGAAAVNPAFGAWDDLTNGSPDRIACVTTRISSAMTNKGITEPTGSNQNMIQRQYVSAAIPAQTITGTVKGSIKCFTDDLAGDYRSQVLIRVVSNDGTTFRTPNLIDFDNSAITNEWNLTTAQTRSFPKGTPPITFNVNSVVASANDRIVIEIGNRHGTGQNGFGTIVFGDNAAADLAENETDTSTNNPWMEFSQDLFAGGGGAARRLLLLGVK